MEQLTDLEELSVDKLNLDQLVAKFMWPIAKEIRKVKTLNSEERENLRRETIALYEKQFPKTFPPYMKLLRSHSFIDQMFLEKDVWYVAEMSPAEASTHIIEVGIFSYFHTRLSEMASQRQSS